MSQTNFEDQNPYLQIGRLKKELEDANQKISELRDNIKHEIDVDQVRIDLEMELAEAREENIILKRTYNQLFDACKTEQDRAEQAEKELAAYREFNRQAGITCDKFEQRVEQAEKERDILHAALEAEQAERKEYRREADRYRQALESIAEYGITDYYTGFMSEIAIEALNKAGGIE